MLIKTIALIILLVIIGSLASGMVYLIRDGRDSKRTLKALKLRIILSLALFALLAVSISAGWIQPHGLTVIRPNQTTPTESSSSSPSLQNIHKQE